MDMQFINKALERTNFNLKTQDFKTTAHKSEIQFLFNTHFFPKFDIKQKAINSFEEDTLNKLIDALRSESPQNFQKIYRYPLPHLGPGEVVFYFLINNAILGGSDKGDLTVGGQKYEIKSVRVSADRFVSKFFLGGTVPLGSLVSKIEQLKIKHKLPGDKATEINKSTIDQIRKLSPDEFNQIEQEFADTAYNYYFKDMNVVFLNNESQSKLGQIEASGKVGKDQIKIELVTRQTIKPMVKI